MPQRIQLKRTKGWRMPPNTVNVARPTIYGNPFVHPDAAQAVAAFRKHCQRGTQTFSISPSGLQFATRIHPNSLHYAWPEWLKEEGLADLRGKDLACWCKPGEPCHADVLLELANAPIVEVPRG